MKPKVLHAITVYNGADFVPRAIRSALSLDQSAAKVDVLVLDDASPSPGFSEQLRAQCVAEGAQYYRTPRNLGIPRNVNLAMIAAVEKGYDYVVINNSDVLFPRNLINVLVQACKTDGAGSVTAWSNNVSIFSLPNADPDRFLSTQETVDFVSDNLFSKFGGGVLDIPAGISFCMIIPTDVIRKVGLMDPVFGRGYCEETDWTLRSLRAGFRICLSPGAFVYHMGRGSNVAAGLLSAHNTSVPENEAIVDFRYPEFRQQVNRFVESNALNHIIELGTACILDAAAANHGVFTRTMWENQSAEYDDRVMVSVGSLRGRTVLQIGFRGFSEQRFVAIHDLASALNNRFSEACPGVAAFNGRWDLTLPEYTYPEAFAH